MQLSTTVSLYPRENSWRLEWVKEVEMVESYALPEQWPGTDCLWKSKLWTSSGRTVLKNLRYMCMHYIMNLSYKVLECLKINETAYVAVVSYKNCRVAVVSYKNWRKHFCDCSRSSHEQVSFFIYFPSLVFSICMF